MRSVSSLVNRSRNTSIPQDRERHYGVWDVIDGSSIDLDQVSSRAGWAKRQLGRCEVASFLVQLAIANAGPSSSRLGLPENVGRLQVCVDPDEQKHPSHQPVILDDLWRGLSVRAFSSALWGHQREHLRVAVWEAASDGLSELPLAFGTAAEQEVFTEALEDPSRASNQPPTSWALITRCSSIGP